MPNVLFVYPRRKQSVLWRHSLSIIGGCRPDQGQRSWPAETVMIIFLRVLCRQIRWQCALQIFTASVARFGDKHFRTISVGLIYTVGIRIGFSSSTWASITTDLCARVCVWHVQMIVTHVLFIADKTGGNEHNVVLCFIFRQFLSFAGAALHEIKEKKCSNCVHV